MRALPKYNSKTLRIFYNRCDVYWLSKGIRSTCYATMSTNLHTRRYAHIFMRAYRRTLKRACSYIHTYKHRARTLKKGPEMGQDLDIWWCRRKSRYRYIYQNGCQASTQGPVAGWVGGGGGGGGASVRLHPHSWTNYFKIELYFHLKLS